MDNFNARKWFKKQYLEEGMSDEEIHAIKRYEELSNEDKLKLAKIQAMMDRERALREDEPEDDMHDDPGDIRIDHDYYTEDLKEDNLNEISRDTYDRMEGLANQRELNELKDLIMILGGEWANEGFENEDIVDYFEVLVGQLVRM
mgnify:CR=1 FL=1